MTGFCKYWVSYLLVLFLGTNDISYFEMQSPKRIANRVFDLALVLLKNGIKRVAFVPCLPRIGVSAFKKRSDNAKMYGSQSIEELETNFAMRAKQFNGLLQRWSDDHSQLDMVILKGLREKVVDWFYDGLHLNREGQTKLMRALRREVNYLCHKAQGGLDCSSTRRPPRRRRRPAWRRFNRR